MTTIRFSCPTCRAAYQVPAGAAGRKSNCRRCGQRLQVPDPAPANRTVLGRLEPEPPLPQGQASPPQLTPVASPGPDRGPDPAAAWRRKRTLVTLCVGGAIVLALLSCAAALLLLLRVPLLGPSASVEGASWTHAELFAHLTARGVEHEVVSRWGGTVLFAPMADIRIDGDDVRVSLEKSAKDARETAGVAGDCGYAWGRFAFRAGRKDPIKRIRQALEGLPLADR